MRLVLVLLGLSLTLAAFAVGPTAASGSTDAASGFATVFNFSYRDSLTDRPVTVVSSGDSVTWLWTVGTHTVTMPGTFNSGLKSPQDPDPTFTVQFDLPGVYPYTCVLHDGMAGVVIVA